MVIEKNKAVYIHYTLKDNDGNTIDSSAGQDPLAYIHGIGTLVPGLEEQLNGKKAGDTFTAIVPPEAGYGTRNEELLRSAPRADFGELGDLEVGLDFYIETPQGPMPATITEISDDEVSFDLNHPLADTTLNFDIEVVSVRDASEDELSHGHIHGPGGHHH